MWRDESADEKRQEEQESVNRKPEKETKTTYLKPIEDRKLEARLILFGGIDDGGVVKVGQAWWRGTVAKLRRRTRRVSIVPKEEGQKRQTYCTCLNECGAAKPGRRRSVVPSRLRSESKDWIVLVGLMTMPSKREREVVSSRKWHEKRNSKDVSYLAWMPSASS